MPHLHISCFASSWYAKLPCFESILSQLWFNLEPALSQLWVYFESTLSQFLMNSEQILKQLLLNSESILDQLWVNFVIESISTFCLYKFWVKISHSESLLYGVNLILVNILGRESKTRTICHTFFSLSEHSSMRGIDHLSWLNALGWFF